MKNFENILEEIKARIHELESEDELTNLWREYLGKKGVIKKLMSKISNEPIETRKKYGETINNLKSQADKIINNAKNEIINLKKQDYLKRHQTKIGFKKVKIGHLHPITETINELNNIFIKLGYSIYDGPELETDEFVFQRCNLPLNHPARDLQDSIFIKEPNILLRTQTSSVEARALKNSLHHINLLFQADLIEMKKLIKAIIFYFININL